MKHYTAADLLYSPGIKQPEPILDPWLRRGEMAMVYAPRGSHKTWFVLGVAQALASASPFVKWRPNKHFSVCYFDGEMGPANIKRRLVPLDGGATQSVEIENLSFVCFDPVRGSWNLVGNSQDFERFIDASNSADVVVLDNFNTLSEPRDRNHDDLSMWRDFRPLMRTWKAAGKAIILVHHAGKSGQQIGTSFRSNDCDTIIKLCSCKVRQPLEGSACELRFEKTRSFFGKETDPLYIEMIDEGQNIKWTWLELKLVWDDWLRENHTYISPGLCEQKLGIPAEYFLQAKARFQKERDDAAYERPGSDLPW